jgi:hypothetical protein
MKPFLHIFMACIIIGGVLLTETSNASICDNKESIVFFGNGVITLKKKAVDSKKIIIKRLKATLPPEEFELLGFDLSYNDTHTLPLDLLESTIQFLTGNVSRFWRILWELDPMPDLVADQMLLLSGALDYSALLTTDSLRDHVKTYQNVIDEGKKVILVAHSQGNLFGNQAYNFLNSLEKQSFGMVSVSNVDNNVLGDASAAALYTTLENDKLILGLIAVQLGLPTSPMTPNTANLTNSEDPWGHSFVGSYMVKDSMSQAQITGDIITLLESLYTPSQVVDPGIITVSLTWGVAPDIDLHVYEPNGTQVNFMNPQGISGTLDYDDRYRFGPEHYRVLTCDMLEEGIYHVALDYYYGSEPETATVQIMAGPLVRTFQVPMSSSYYGSEWYPELVANVWVREGENGGYDFEIYE